MKILMLESTHFESHFRVGCHHYAHAFVAAGHELLYVSHYVSPLHRFAVRGDDVRRRQRQHRAGVVERHPGLLSYVPFTWFPIAGSRTPRFVARLSLRDELPRFRALLDRSGFRHPDLVLVSHVQLVNLLQAIPSPSRLFFRCTDDMASFPELPAWISDEETCLAGRSHGVICSSAGLARRFSSQPGVSRVLYLPNGVDHARFAAAIPAGGSWLDGLPRPRIIYVGAIDSWFDEETLASLARRRPDCSFLIVGPQRRPLERLSGLPNLHLLGPRPYSSIPGILASCDVGLIPFLRTPLVESVSPIKLFEYLAAGLPVVSTRWNELEEVKSPALLASNRGEFHHFLDEALDRQEELAEAGRRYAVHCDWSARARRLLEFVA